MTVFARICRARHGRSPPHRDRKLQGQRFRIEGVFFMRAVPDRQPPGQMRRIAICVAATVMFR
ncbi:hypothetical protein BV379_13700 [Rhodovulum sulfidophilum]|nr:hypothetical protein BV379_13700 [Rhodovulum sulfidophilum]